MNTISENDDVLALRQKVNKYLASVDEWTKLADKERESADALIAALLAENEKLRAFNAAFELWLQSHILTEDDGNDYWVISPTEHSTHEDVRRQWRILKVQHLGDSEGE